MDHMTAWPVSIDVGSVWNNRLELCEPVKEDSPESDPQMGMFG
jgi:hypothetical protein